MSNTTLTSVTKVPGPTRARLRTKTGCLTCRRRRKKCNEAQPSCGECSFAGRLCEWPGTQDLLDRRFLSHEHSRHKTHRPKTAIADAQAHPGDGPSNSRRRSKLIESQNPNQYAVASPRAFGLASVSHLRAESGAAFVIITHDASVALSRHFVERYYDLLLLPSCHRGFYLSWLTEIEALMGSCKSLYYSALACSAAHMQLQSNADMDTSLSPIRFYTNATKELSGLITQTTEPEGDNGLLTSVILMYLHGCMGLGTYSDIPIHVNAAIRILTMRLHKTRGSLTQPFDKIAIESVIYQIFLVVSGLWTEPAGILFEFNAEFWAQADDLLERSTFFPGRSICMESPVLGVPMSLFRLALVLRSQFCSGAPPDQDVLQESQSEVEDWEAALLSDEFVVPGTAFGRDGWQSTTEMSEQICKDSERLFAIIVSLLYEQLTQRDVRDSPPHADSKAWQTRKAIRILKRHEQNKAWSRCYIGNWPVYTIGFFMETLEDQEVVRNDMERRWSEIGFAQIARFRDDLEATWASRSQKS